MENAPTMNANAAREATARIVREFPQHFGVDLADAQERGCRYYLVRVLGQGASAIVLQIKRVTDDQPFALKFVDLTKMQEADRQRARAEIDCLVSCDIFTVVKCHEEFVKFPPNKNRNGGSQRQLDDEDPASPTTPHENGSAATNRGLPRVAEFDAPNSDLDNPRMFALVLDYANAGDLRMEIKNRARTGRCFREHEAGLLFLQVLLAVHHVHSRHMIHRDIKTANVLLCTNGLLKLGDFGFSRIYNTSVSGDVGRTFCGTPYYVAPEIWKRRPYSKKADIFSIGVLLYELLTLRRPFDGQSVRDVMERTLSASYEPLPETISPEMRKLVDLLLSDNPAQRPSTRELLCMPISKLFLDALVGIILTQNTFDEALRAQIREDVRIVRESLDQRTNLSCRHLRFTRFHNPDAAAGSYLTVNNDETTRTQQRNDRTTEIQGIVLNQDDIVCEGMLKKLSIDGSWKRRYLCIVHHRSPVQKLASTTVNGPSTSSPELAAGELMKNPPIDPPERFDLILAVTKEGAADQCIITNFGELEDVFPVPFKYAGPGLNNVFAIAFKSGVKRLTFQASTWEENCAWRTAIQMVLGIDDLPAGYFSESINK